MTMLPRAFTLFARAARPGRRVISTQSGLAVHAEHRAQAPLEEFSPIRPTHNVHIATLHFRAHPEDLNDLKFFSTFAGKAARALGCPSSGIASLPTKTTKFATPRSPFAHKKSQEVFWRKVHKRCIKIYDTDSQVVRFLISYLRQNALPTVPFKVELIEYKELGWGKSLSPADEQVSLQSAIVERADELLKELAAEVTEASTEASKAASDVESTTATEATMEATTEAEAATETKVAPAQEIAAEVVDKAPPASEAATEAAASPVTESVPEPEAVAPVPEATLAEEATPVPEVTPAPEATLAPEATPTPTQAEASTPETAPTPAAPSETEPEIPAKVAPKVAAKAAPKV